MSASTRQTAAHRPFTSAATILVVGLESSLQWDDLKILCANNEKEALHLLCEENVSVLILGNRLNANGAREILAQYLAEHPDACTSNIVLASRSSLELFQPFVDRDQLFYLSSGPIPDAQIRSLILAGVQRFHARQKAIRDGMDTTEAPDDRVLEFCTRLSLQTDLGTAGELLVEAIQILINADRGYYLIYDEQEATLWSAKLGDNGDERRESCCAGLLGYVARTAEPVRLERAGEDSRYDAEADDPGGRPDTRFVAEPMRGNGDAVIAVVAAARGGEGECFSDGDIATLQLLTACAASAFSGMLLQRRIKALLLEQVQSTVDRAKVFREEALQYYAAEQNEEGEILHGSPPWLNKTHWLIVALLLLGFLWMALARVHQNADGQAVVKALRKMTATATTAGLIRSVVVAQGDYVKAGDLLVQFYDSAGTTTLERLKQEVRSPSDGVVSDIRVHAGQPVNAGDQIATIVDESGGYELVAFFPGYYAPQLHPGMNIVLKVSGYPESHESFVIRHVGAEIIGPHEAQQYAGRESADAALQVSGPVVSVRAPISRRAFQAGEDSYLFYDGMTGQTEVEVHSESLLVYLFPGLKGILKK
jgi:hypothetical protein